MNHNKVRYGHFLTRCIANALTSLGLVALCFYRSGWKFMTIQIVWISFSGRYFMTFKFQSFKNFLPAVEFGSAVQRSNGYCIMVSWVFMACSAVYYIGSNSSLVPFFGTFAGLAMMLICGVFDMSAALFLLFKLAWQNYERFKLIIFVISCELEFMSSLMKK